MPSQRMRRVESVREALSIKTCALLLSLLLIVVGRPMRAEGDGHPATDRRREIDARIADLDAERAETSTQGPKVATLLGLGLLVAGGVAFGVGHAACQDSVETYGGCGGDPSALATKGAGIGLLAVGGIATVAGLIVWGVQSNRRSELDAERESLMKERGGLGPALSHLEVGGSFRDDTHFVTLGVRF